MDLGYNYSGFARCRIATSRLQCIPREQNCDDTLGKIDPKRSNCNKRDEGAGGDIVPVWGVMPNRAGPPPKVVPCRTRKNLGVMPGGL